MSDRPTPEQRREAILDIAAEAIDAVSGSSSYLHGRLASIEDYLHGCTIVHPDDIPESQIPWMNEHGSIYDEGWNTCRDHIFAAVEPTP